MTHHLTPSTSAFLNSLRAAVIVLHLVLPTVLCVEHSSEPIIGVIRSSLVKHDIHVRTQFGCAKGISLWKKSIGPPCLPGILSWGIGLGGQEVKCIVNCLP